MKRVTYNIAKTLVGHGFPQGGHGDYYISTPISEDQFEGLPIADDGTDEGFEYRQKKLGLVYAPYLEDVAEWLREEEDIHVCPEYCELSLDRWYIVTIGGRPLEGSKTSKINNRPINYPLRFETYNEALEAGINHVLTNILNNTPIKNKKK